MQQISVHRALTLIEKTKRELQDLSSSGLFISTVEGSKKTPTDRSYKSFDELSKRIQSDTDSLQSKLNLYTLLKTKVTESNLVTKVIFLDKEYTVTELLSLKETLSYRERVLFTLRQQLQNAQLKANESEVKIAKQLEPVEQHLQASAKETFNSMWKVDIITGFPNKSPAEVLKQMTEELNKFKEDLDLTLSESNIKTLIELE